MANFRITTNDGRVFMVPGQTPREAADLFERSAKEGGEASVQQWAAAGSPAPAKPKAYSGAILPFTRDDANPGTGILGSNVHFDPNAGILGGIKEMVKGPGEAMAGRLNPLSDEGVKWGIETAAGMTPTAEVGPALTAKNVLTGVGETGRPPTMPKGVEIPTSRELLDVGGAGLDAARASNLYFHPRAVVDMADRAGIDINGKGFSDVSAPKTFSILDRLKNPPIPENPGDRVIFGMGDLMRTREELGNLAVNDKSEKAAATRAVKILDNFLGDPPKGSVLSGDAAKEAANYAEARANYAAGKRGQLLDQNQNLAELNADTANSGRNIDNAIRQRAKAVLKTVDPDLPQGSRKGFSDDEIAALKEVAAGSPSQNALRTVSNLLGGGGGMGAAVSGTTGAGLTAYLTGNPQLAAIAAGATPAIGWLLKSGENAMSRDAMESVAQLTRTRSPLFSQRVAEAGGYIPSPNSIPADLLRAIVWGSAARGPSDPNEITVTKRYRP